ncbi:MAG: acetolactate decarboxylase [Arcicella sp.]|nr:acetolactate decarboxylase [Arcicella sp.]
MQQLCVIGQRHERSTVNFVGSMSEMGKDNFAPHISLDSIKNKKHLYALGPLGKMQGEITVVDGKPFGVKVNADGDGIVKKNWKIKAPFFVSSNVKSWQTFEIETAIGSLDELQKKIEEIAQQNNIDLATPFAFKINGKFDNLTTHVVMPRSSDVEGYQTDKKQANFELSNQEGELIGFYSQNHGGIYTHKDSRVHVHFISSDKTQMGHLDKIMITKKVKVQFPAL